jgi:serine/threonine kinase 32
MGHAHLTDFNVAIHYSERRQHTSVAGSMAYMAPQVVGRKGYSWQIDWWSLGITAYELLFHSRPFDGRSSEKMTNSILKDPLRFPEDADTRCSEVGLSALSGVSAFTWCLACLGWLISLCYFQFLDRDPETRLGCRPHGKGLKDVQQHPWFAHIHWDSLTNKESQPPYVPDVSPTLLYVVNVFSSFPFYPSDETSELRCHTRTR